MEYVQLDNFIFDLDGTLVDSKGDIVYCLTETYSKLDLSLDLSRLVIGPTLDEIVKILTPGVSEELLERIFMEYRKQYMAINYERSKVFSGVVETLDILKKENKRLFIATNKPIKPSIRLLDILNLNYFEFIGTPDYTSGAYKKKTEVIDHIVSSYNLDRAKTVMIGDTHTDLIAGNNNNLYTVAFTGGYGDLNLMKEQNPTHIFSNFSEILNLI